MQVVALLMFSLAGMGVIAALSAALYAGLPHHFLESAELHGRFHGLGAWPADGAVSNGTPTETAPDGVLSGMAA